MIEVLFILLTDMKDMMDIKQSVTDSSVSGSTEALGFGLRAWLDVL